MKYHIIYTPMTGVGLNNGFRGQAWLDYRIEIFKKYTLKSLLNQTNNNFLHVISFRPEEAENKSIDKLAEFIRPIKDYKVAFCFNGLMYHDDKFNQDIKSYTMNTARLIRDYYRGTKKFKLKDFKEIYNNKNKTLKERLKITLTDLKTVVPKCEYIYFTRIYSDDMFHKDAFDKIQKEQPAYKKALTFKNGYAFNEKTKKLSQWKPKTNPPFHTIIFPYEFFFNEKRYLEYMKGFRSHEDIIKLYQCTQLPDFNYCVNVHGNHISTTWNHPFNDKTKFSEKETKEIMENFGIIV